MAEPLALPWLRGQRTMSEDRGEDPTNGKPQNLLHRVNHQLKLQDSSCMAEPPDTPLPA